VAHKGTKLSISATKSWTQCATQYEWSRPSLPLTRRARQGMADEKSLKVDLGRRREHAGAHASADDRRKVRGIPRQAARDREPQEIEYKTMRDGCCRESVTPHLDTVRPSLQWAGSRHARLGAFTAGQTQRWYR